MMFALDATNGSIYRAETEAFQPITEQDVSVAEADQSRRDQPREAVVALNNSTPSVFANFPSLVVAKQAVHTRLPLPPGSTIELMSSVDGMSLTADGNFSWTPRSADIGVHEIKVRIRRNGAYSFQRNMTEVIDPEIAAELGGDLTRLDEFPKLELSQDQYQIAMGFQFGHHLILQGDELSVVGGNGIQLLGRRTWRVLP